MLTPELLKEEYLSLYSRGGKHQGQKVPTLDPHVFLHLAQQSWPYRPVIQSAINSLENRKSFRLASQLQAAALENKALKLRETPRRTFLHYATQEKNQVDQAHIIADGIRIGAISTVEELDEARKMTTHSSSFIPNLIFVNALFNARVYPRNKRKLLARGLTFVQRSDLETENHLANALVTAAQKKLYETGDLNKIKKMEFSDPTNKAKVLSAIIRPGQKYKPKKEDEKIFQELEKEATSSLQKAQILIEQNRARIKDNYDAKTTTLVHSLTPTKEDAQALYLLHENGLIGKEAAIDAMKTLNPQEDNLEILPYLAKLHLSGDTHLEINTPEAVKIIRKLERHPQTYEDRLEISGKIHLAKANLKEASITAGTALAKYNKRRGER